MKKKILFTLVTFILLFPLALSACGKPSQVTVPVPAATNWVPTFGAAQASDDIILTPSGPAYAGNTASANTTHPLTPVSTAQVTLSQNSTVAYVSYRAVIETQKPAVHNDIINVFMMGKSISMTQPTNAVQGLSIYLQDLPVGVTVTEGMQINSPLSTSSVLVFDISETAKTGKHDFKIEVIVNGIDFGTLDCTLNITA